MKTLTKWTVSVVPNAAPLDEVLSYQNPDVVDRIVREHKMKPDQAELVFRDTLRFLYLAGATSAKHLAPTKNIDAGWHCFLMFTRDYSTFCQTYFGRFIHHEPRRLRDAAQTLDQRSATFDVAREVFGPSLSVNWTQHIRVGETEPCTSRCSPDTGGGGDDCTPDSGD